VQARICGGLGWATTQVYPARITPRGYIWKNAKKTQRDRVIFLTPKVQAYVEKFVAKQPKGPIFCTPSDAGWLPTFIGNKWRWLVKRARVVAYCWERDIDPDSLKPYNFRDSWACDYFDTTGDIFGDAMMLGTSVKMLRTRYFHMDMDKLHERFLAYSAGR